jgi:Fe-S oxidoreductase
MKMEDMNNPEVPLVELKGADLMELPNVLDHSFQAPRFKALTDAQQKQWASSLDGFVAIGIPRPATKEEEDAFVKNFLNGVEKLLSKQDNWTFLQPLFHSLEFCVKCQTCSDSCPVYTASGKQEIYRPTFRPELLRRIISKYIKKRGRFSSMWTRSDVQLNFTLVARLAELAYRCTLCRRCAQVCPIGVDNALVSREIRKLFSQEMGIAPKEIHDSGTVQHLNVGASTGISPDAFRNMIEFMEDEIEERTGRRIKVPVDKEGADILLIHNSGEFMSWIDNPAAFSIIFEEAGVNWTLSSEIFGYEAVNYGTWYDDIQFARIALKQIEVAKRLKVKKIVIGECGHAHKGLVVVADRLLLGEMNFPRESFLPLLEDLVLHGRLKLDPRKNDFPVTLHDPCNLVRLMGIVHPQRRILREVCPQFREMEPHGVENYCCGGGSGFAIMSQANFQDWRIHVSGRMKLKQILDSFQDVMGPDIKKYVCAPCSNCKGQIRDLISHYELGERNGMRYGGLVELVANGMVSVRKPFIEWE